MIDWLSKHVWVCTYIIAALAVLTFVLNFIIKKHNVNKSRTTKIKQKSSHNQNSTVNQIGGDTTINNN